MNISGAEIIARTLKARGVEVLAMRGAASPAARAIIARHHQRAHGGRQPEGEHHDPRQAISS